MTNTVKSLEEEIKLQVRYLAFFSHDTKKREPNMVFQARTKWVRLPISTGPCYEFSVV